MIICHILVTIQTPASPDPICNSSNMFAEQEFKVTKIRIFGPKQFDMIVDTHVKIETLGKWCRLDRMFVSLKYKKIAETYWNAR